ncbi:ANTAR domain-containing protein [Streptomyces sp. NPDC055085]
MDPALGILTARFHLRPDRGLDILRTLSQNLDGQLPDVAAEVIQWGLGHPPRSSVDEELSKLIDELAVLPCGTSRRRASGPGRAGRDGDNPRGALLACLADGVLAGGQGSQPWEVHGWPARTH